MANKSSKNSIKTYNFTQSKLFGVVVLSIIVGAFGALLTVYSFAAGGKNTGGKYNSTLELRVVQDANGDGLPNFADTVAFDYSTTWADTSGSVYGPWFELTCSQNGITVFGANTGYGKDYPWPWTREMKLQSSYWTGGAADCSARLYGITRSKQVTLATLQFAVQP